MDEEVRRRLAYEVQRRKQRGESERAISRALAIHRNTVRRLLEELEARREHGESALEREVRKPAPRGSKLDRYKEEIEAWLKEYENLTAVRLHEKLLAHGFDGGYTIVREHLKALRERRKPKQAFALVETPAGQQAQFDWSPYVLPGCGAEVNLWSCTLSWSRARSFEASDNTRQTTHPRGAFQAPLARRANGRDHAYANPRGHARASRQTALVNRVCGAARWRRRRLIDPARTRR